MFYVTSEAPEICSEVNFMTLDVAENRPEKVEQMCWFAMRVTFKRELGVKQMLDLERIENFIPMRREVKLVKGRRVALMTPVVHNLLFVHASRTVLQAFKAKVPHLQYMTRRIGQKNEPIIVPDWQMRDFITVSASDDKNLIYFEKVEDGMCAGSLVRIHGGSFDGVTGTFVKVKGKRSKQVVIAIQNIVAVAIDAKNYDYIEIIDE